MVKSKGKKRTSRNIRLRKRLWPNLKDQMIWDWSKEDTKGFITIPRTIPYFCRIMDDLSKNKPVSSTYLALWCRNWDHSCVFKIRNHLSLARESGFSGQRAISTWRGRMGTLQQLGFIKVKPLADEKYGYVLIVNPYFAVKKLIDKKTYADQGWFNALWERHDAIKATDLEDLEDDENGDE